MKSRALLALILIGTLAASGCGRTLLEDEQELQRALAATERAAREFVYQETEPRSVAVKGVIEDDLRYSVLYAEDGFGVVEKIIADDTLAVRVLDPAKVPELNFPPIDEAVAASLQALSEGKWVIDPSGAPPLQPATVPEVAKRGEDPIVDALAMMAYLRLALRESAGIKEWQKDDVDPAYRGSEDTFDPPQESLGVKRYDLIRVPLPRRDPSQGGEAQPRNFHFRKMAFYVRDGRVIKVVEEIEVESHFEIRRAREEGRPEFLLELADRIGSGNTEERIRERRMSIEFTVRDEATVAVPDGLTSSLVGIFTGLEEEEVSTPVEPTEGSTTEPSPSGEVAPSP